LQSKRITRRQKRLEKLINFRTKELVRTKAQMENIIEYAGSPIITVNRTGKVLTWNKRAEEVFGYTKIEIAELNIKSLDLAEDNYPFFDILNETDNSGQMYQLELKKLTKDKKEVELMITTSHLKDDERFTIVMEDFTARNQLVQSLINRENLLGAIGALNKLLATLSHYINNALMAITGMSQLSKMDPKFMNRFMETTDNQALRIQAVIKSLSDLVQTLNLKTRQYVGKQSFLFDIEKEIENYIKLIGKDLEISENASPLPSDSMDSNDVY
jgi:PAS domain S-box-containing protein